MNELPLSKGYVALVDEADWDAASTFKWTAYCGRRIVYAGRHEAASDGKRRLIRLHRWLINAPPHMDVDHIDGNGLNCRRANLRLATRSQNSANSVTIRGKVGYRGVFIDKNGKFRSQIRCGPRKIHLGVYTTAEEAAKVYREARNILFGQFSPDRAVALLLVGEERIAQSGLGDPEYLHRKAWWEP